MSKKILIDAVYPGETRVVIHDKNLVQDFDYENSHKKQLKGNIYLARITRVEPSLQAAFIEYGGDKHGFLPFNEIHPNYFNVEGNEGQEKTGKSLESKVPFINITETADTEEESTTDNKNDATTEPSSAEANKSKDIVKPTEDNIEVNGNKTNEEVAKTESDETETETDETETEEDTDPHHNSSHQKYKIQDVVKKGQIILIQVIKEERGNKGAACTTYLSLAGRYCVLMPNSDRQGGVSRRIQNQNDRKRLKDMLSALELPEGVSIILRTAGADRNPNDIRRDYYYLARLWNAIREYALTASVNSFIHAESDLLKRTIRDLYSSEVIEIQIQGNAAFKSAKEFMKKMLPTHAHKVKEYRSKIPIFTKFNVEDQISALYSPTAILPSGGYIVINPTEALIAIDINSGKATSEKNIEETATKTNIEAATEIARQLRLRDMSGLIVIDFIDMMDSNNRRLVEKNLREAFHADRSKIQLGNISAFGLLELSRQRLQSSFMETNTVICPSCKGKGHIKSFETNALIMLRAIEVEAHKGDCQEVNIYAHPELALHMLNNKREQLARIESLYKCKIVINKEETVYYDGFGLEKTTKNLKHAGKSNSPEFSEEEYFDSYGQDVIETEVVSTDSKLAPGEDISPYQVNDDNVMKKTVDNYNKNNRDKNRKPYDKRRKISGSTERQPTSSQVSPHQPATIYQPEGQNKYKGPKRRNNRYNKDRKDKNVDGNNANTNAKESVLKSWWNKLID
jgi:ribonuclease E